MGESAEKSYGGKTNSYFTHNLVILTTSAWKILWLAETGEAGSIS